MKKVILIPTVILILCIFVSYAVSAGEIHKAIKKNDLGKVTEILDKDPSAVNSREKMAGSTPVHIAAICGYREITILLISRGADINIKDITWGVTPLHWAKNPEIAIVLLNAGASINAKDKFGGTPLFAAVSNGNTEMVRFLLTRGADVNAKTSYNMTPLQKALELQAKQGEKFNQIVDILRKHGGK
jgi:ankyrin repeat protein